MGEDRKTTPDEQARQLFGEAEKRTASAMEGLVRTDAFGEILARVTENVMGVTKIGFDVLDLTVRNLRLAGRPDLIRVGRQLARTEDKLERVLQEVERLQDELSDLKQEPPRRSAPSGNGSGSSSARRRSGSSNGGRKAKSKSSG